MRESSLVKRVVKMFADPMLERMASIDFAEQRLLRVQETDSARL